MARQSHINNNIDFSVDLERWFAKNRNKTIGHLLDFFGEKSFAILFLHFMFIPALPVPTGGITTLVFVPSVVIASLQMIFGRRSLWLPERVRDLRINGKILSKAIPFMMRRIRWLEKFSQPRLSFIFGKAVFRTFIGIVVLILALAAQIAPPFSGFDTLPALGIVIVALSMILEDVWLTILGIIIGIAGVGALAAVASAITFFFQRIF
jgi:hypothetical protein